MTYTISQLQRAHERAHQEAKAGAGQANHKEVLDQRVNVMDEVLARMMVYGKRTLDRGELQSEVASMIDHFLRPT
jgi:hypothetical protein